MGHKNLGYGITFGMLAGAGIGAVLWGVTGNLFAISMGAGLGLLAGAAIGALLDRRGDGRP